MKTLLFATGETKKLQPLTNAIVSPMLPLLSRPVMDYNLELLGKQNIKEIDISLYEKPGLIEAHFGDGGHRGLDLKYHLQREAWGDGGAVRWAFEQADESVLILPADILIDFALEPFVEFHRRHANGITALVSKSTDSYPRQVRPLLDQDGIHNIINNRFSSGFEATGIYLLGPEIIAKIPYRKHFDILNDLIPQMLTECLPVVTYEFQGFWNPLQTFMQYRAALLRLCTEDHPDGKNKQSLKYISRQGRQVWKGVWIGRNNVIHPSVRIASIFYSHENNRIEKEVQIGPNVIIGKNIVIDQEASLSDAVILDNTYIGRLMNIQSKIVYKNLVIDIQTGEYISIRDQFMLAENEEKHLDLGFQRILSSVLALALFIGLLPLILLIALYLAAAGTRVLCTQDCTHSDFRWFIPIEERRIHQFQLLLFQVHRKSGAAVPLSKFLEKSQLINLPQLLNVIKGDLAFVGVKPLQTSVVNELTEEWQKTRFSVPAGITGLWYLKTDPNASLDQILITDAYYSTRRNWKEDLNILIQTPRTWFKQFINHRIPADGNNL